MATKELSIKLLINTKTGKLCFAEASSDVVEFLTGLLSLPLGTKCGHLSEIYCSACPGCNCYRQNAMTLAGETNGPVVVAAAATKPCTPSRTTCP